MMGSCRGLHRLFNRLLTRVRHVGSAKSFSTTHSLIRGCTIGMSPRLRSRMLAHCGGLGLTPCGKFIGPECSTIVSRRKGVMSMRMACSRNCTRRVLHCDESCSPLPSVGSWLVSMGRRLGSVGARLHLSVGKIISRDVHRGKLSCGLGFNIRLPHVGDVTTTCRGDRSLTRTL